MSWLAQGPRGRRLCWELLCERDLALPWINEPWRGTDEDFQRAAQIAAQIDVVLGTLDLDGLAVTEAELVEACGRSVGWARYWQAPDDADLWLAQPAVRGAMEAVSTAIAALIPPWWHSGMAAGAQVQTDLRPDEPARRLAPQTAADTLAYWRRDTLRDEEDARRRPTDLDANVGGRWYSTPYVQGLPSSTRALADPPAVELLWREDSLGEEQVACQAVTVPAGARVYEIDGPEAFVHLVERYPLELTLSRRHDWWRATGAKGPLLIPDYAAVAADFHGVHLTVAGYLRTAGRALPTSGGATTVLAGWDPDKTWWLTDLEVAGSSTRWSLSNGVWAETAANDG